jgi:DNA processing protein
VLTALLGEGAPPILYVRGAAALLNEAGIGFSGSRHVSELGVAHTATLAEQAVDRGWTVVSGGAAGVDVVAHRTALQRGGSTIIVAAEGALHFRLHADVREFAESESDRLLVISEFAPKMSWSAGNAMTRNRTILGLSQALCVIEAGETGGTLDAGRSALMLGIPTFILDYPDPPPSAAGNRLLLSEGAAPIALTPQPLLPAIPERGTTPKPTSGSTQLSLF